MDLSRMGFSIALCAGVSTIGPYGIADDPAAPTNEKEVIDQVLRPGRFIAMGGPGFVGTPGPARVGPCIVSARLDGDAIVVAAERAEDVAKVSLDVACYKVDGNAMSRMGPMMIEAFRAPVEIVLDAKTGVGEARVALPEGLAGTDVFVAPHAQAATNDDAVATLTLGGAYVLKIPGEAKS